MVFSAYSHPGKVRKNNEDYFFIPTAGAQVKNLMMVADGMGGHNAGDVASRMVVEAIVEYYSKNSHKVMSIEQARDLVLKSIQHANGRVYNQSRTVDAYKGMGTTLTLAYFFDHRVCIGHVGDSRAYLIRHRSVSKITRDHSLVQELLEKGKITQEEMDSHPQKNIITRALGTAEEVAVDYYEVELEDNDIIVLCTDGLSNHVDLNKNVDLFYSTESLDEITSSLGEMALEAGGADNVTVVMAKYSCATEKR
ncbi:protein phosphatase [Caldicoprobacter guelmensis]|uniref:Stp1/IreP family PP2C-type Ser/Thr phosphatase n=1 Tax=Caldicoprobacter guelmensis TaxID=1170224 RepID=UPI00195A01DF|nr:Stp1/IreP family PP2C-type Ser/Thr phosphatase [Caldicoprobacter guelmensis]MBM7581900.1 protein phosphatase [Caldicoprobacter guelmensis]